MADNVERLELQVVTRGADKAAADLVKVQRAEVGVGTAAKTSTSTATTAWEEYQKKLNAATNKMTLAISKSLEVYEAFGPAAAAGQAEALAAVEAGNKALIAAFTTGGEAMAVAMQTSLARIPVSVTEAYAAAAVAAEKGSARVGVAARAGHVGTSLLEGGGLKGVVGGLGATAAVMGAFELTKSSIDNASAANEAQTTLNQLAPGLSERISSMDTANTMGLSKGKAMEGLAGIISQYVQAGMNPDDANAAAIKTLQGSADIGALRNVDPSDVLAALQSGMAGQTRALRKVGIYVSTSDFQTRARQMYNLGKGQAPTRAQTMNAAYQVITGSAGWQQAQGNFAARLPTSFAIKQRAEEAQVQDQEEKLGEAMLPFAVKGLEFFTWMLTKIAPLLEGALNVLNKMFGGEAVTSGNDFAKTGASAVAAAKAAHPNDPAAVARDVIDSMNNSNANNNDTTQGWLRLLSWINPLIHNPGSTKIPGVAVKAGQARGGVLGGWSPGIDNMLVPLSGGEGILTPETVAMLGGANSINSMNLAGLRRRGGYANGTSSAARTAGMLGGQALASSNILSGLFNPNGTPVGTASNVGSAAGGVPVAGWPTAVGRWGADVRLGMQMRGLNANGADFARVMNQLQLESSGDPNAINLTDSNARKGTPSIGLLQVIQPTFDEYAYPGYGSNIRDPMSNILASLGYMLGRYGSVQKAVGPGGVHPYDDGGWLKPGTTAVSALDKPEPVLTPEQWDTARKAIEHAASGVTVSIGTIDIAVGAGSGVSGADLASAVRDGLADAIAVRVHRSNDRRL